MGFKNSVKFEKKMLIFLEIFTQKNLIKKNWKKRPCILYVKYVYQCCINIQICTPIHI